MIFRDTEGICHSVEVSAESLFEAAALGLKALRGARLLDSEPGPGAELEIAITQPAVTHRLAVRRVRQWLQTSGKTPREQATKQRLRELLALNAGL